MDKNREHHQLSLVLDALKVEMVINQALIDLLVEKGIMTHDELQAKITQIKVRDNVVLSSDAAGKTSN